MSRSSARASDPLVRCAGCGTTLAAEVAGLLYVQHRRRKILGRILSITCDRCGAVWQSDDTLHATTPTRRRDELVATRDAAVAPYAATVGRD